MRRALVELKAGRHPHERLRFEELQELVGFKSYDDALRRYTTE